MQKYIRQLGLFFIIYYCLTTQVCFGNSLQVEIANLNQDLMDLTQRVGRLQMHIEKLQIANERLEKLTKTQHGGLTEKDLNPILHKQKEEILSIVAQQIKTLAQEFNKTLSTHPSTPVHPTEGVSYTVKKGDTLSKIALENQSTVNYIQAANHIDNPKEIKIGQVLFIPQKK